MINPNDYKTDNVHLPYLWDKLRTPVYQVFDGDGALRGQLRQIGYAEWLYLTDEDSFVCTDAEVQFMRLEAQ